MEIKDLKKYNEVKEVTSNTLVEGTIYNKTRKYLLPSLNIYGKGFIVKFIKLDLFAVGVEDKERQVDYDNCITILVKGESSDIDFDIPHLADEYFFGESLYGKLHALVIKLPVKNLKDRFLAGEYSKLYRYPEKIFKGSKKNIDKNLREANARDVCSKSKDYRKKLEILLGEEIEPTAELDTIPDKSKEIFNYECNTKDCKVEQGT